MSELSEDIEAFLLERREWVKTGELIARFGVAERQLRAVGDSPGLCTEFAISGNGGFRHVQACTDAEFQRFYGRMRSHGIRQLIRLRRLARKRGNLLSKRTPAQSADGQLLIELPGLNQPTNTTHT